MPRTPPRSPRLHQLPSAPRRQPLGQVFPRRQIEPVNLQQVFEEAMEDEAKGYVVELVESPRSGAENDGQGNGEDPRPDDWDSDDEDSTYITVDSDDDDGTVEIHDPNGDSFSTDSEYSDDEEDSDF